LSDILASKRFSSYHSLRKTLFEVFWKFLEMIVNIFFLKYLANSPVKNLRL
jgi:hypothetical protein